MTITLNQPYSFCQLGKRGNQEDCRYPNSNEPAHYEPFFIVCDGVGGCADGEVASRAVAEGMAKVLHRVDWNGEFTQDDLQEALLSAYQALDVAARHASDDMATTFTLVCFHAGGCTMAYMGDSRIYQFRPGQGMLYCSDDHSLINELVHAGIVSPDQAKTHPQRNVINRYMAPTSAEEQRCQPTWYQTADVKDGDCFLLCTDGVTDTIDNDTLEAIICGDGSDEEKRNRIARLCTNSKDNNTAYLVSIAQVSNDKDEQAGWHKDSDDNDTRRSTGSAPVNIDLELAEQEVGILARFSQFFKKIFNL
jgi:protein phosphatase